MGVHNNRNALQIPEKINRNDPNNDRNALQKSEKNNRSAMIIRNSRVRGNIKSYAELIKFDICIRFFRI